MTLSSPSKAMKTNPETDAIPAHLVLKWFASRGEPLRPLSLAFFWVAALAPAIFALLASPFAGPEILRSSVPFVWSVALICPVVCGFWIAARHSEHRVAFVINGTVISLLLVAMNWIIAVEGCCATLR